MKTVRFTHVVEKSGRPEIYLLLDKGDVVFKKALKAHRIMSVVQGPGPAKAGHGLVGYKTGQRGQLLLFPKSLKPYEGCRIVGLRYELFSEEYERSAHPVSRKKDMPVQRKGYQGMRPKVEKEVSAKIIPFPSSEQGKEGAGEIDEKDLRKMIKDAKRLLRAGELEAAYRVLDKA